MIFRAFTFGVATTVGVALGLWTIDRDPPVVINSVQVLTPEVPPGGRLRIKYQVNRIRECAVHIDRLLLDSAKVRGELTDLSFAKPPGPLGNDEYTTEIRVPDTFSQGPAVYRTLTTYRCNLIHAIWPVPWGPNDVSFVVRGMAAPAPAPPELASP
jgi:hypothetical protein